ncbi:unnamed protein product, partial [Dicrocoelium dendriticum]
MFRVFSPRFVYTNRIHGCYFLFTTTFSFQIFINNEFVNSVSGKTFPTVKPATEEIICQVQEGDEADVTKAVAAAKAAFRRDTLWRIMDASARGRLLYKLSDLVKKNAEYIA